MKCDQELFGQRTPANRGNSPGESGDLSAEVNPNSERVCSRDLDSRQVERRYGIRRVTKSKGANFATLDLPAGAVSEIQIQNAFGVGFIAHEWRRHPIRQYARCL